MKISDVKHALVLTWLFLHCVCIYIKASQKGVDVSSFPIRRQGLNRRACARVIIARNVELGILLTKNSISYKAQREDIAVHASV